MAPIILNCSKVCYFYSKIAKSFQMGPTKLRYFVNFRVAPYSKSILIENIKGSSYYIVWFDDSVNSMSHMRLICYSDTLMKSIIRWNWINGFMKWIDEITFHYLCTTPFNLDSLKVMKRVASCKYRETVKTIQHEKKLFNSHLHSF